MAKRADVLPLLESVPLFSGCSKKDLQTIAKCLEVIEYPEGAAIVTQGEAGNAFYIVLDGHTVVRRNGRKVGEIGPGEYFGELALLDPSPRNADVVASAPATVARLLVKDFRSLLREVPAMNERLLAGLAHRLRESDRRTVE
ncbi:MAG: cyclic nucleotide-binding domain-containing protein [Actinomycetota bacterium]|nr:cyclic nucleotide-binding domain-containing protein [Actinomycetota bacterium]